MRGLAAAAPGFDGNWPGCPDFTALASRIQASARSGSRQLAGSLLGIAASLGQWRRHEDWRERIPASTRSWGELVVDNATPGEQSLVVANERLGGGLRRRAGVVQTPPFPAPCGAR